MISDLGYLRLANGDYAGAQALFERSLARRESLYGADSERLLAGLGGLAEALEKQGALTRAEQVARRAIALGEASKTPSSSRQVLLGSILVAQGRATDGEAACTQARTMAEARGAAGRTQAADAMLCLGRARLAASDPAGAAPLVAEALRIREAAYGADHPAVATALLVQGRVLVRQGDAKAARAAVARAVRIRERRLRPAHPLIGEAREVAAELR